MIYHPEENGPIYLSNGGFIMGTEEIKIYSTPT